MPQTISGAGQLHRQLTSFGALLLTLSCLSPVFSVYGIGGDVLQHAGTGAAALFLIGIAAAVVWAVIYAELGSAYPYAGGDYVAVGTILGPWAGFASLTIWVATGRSPPIFLKISLKRGMKKTMRNAIAQEPITMRRVG